MSMPWSRLTASVGALDFGFKKGRDLNRRAARALLAGIVLIWLVAAAYLVLVSQTTVMARRIQDMREQLATLERENCLLEQEIAVRQSVDALLRAAAAQGFAPAAAVEFVEP